MNVSVVLPLIMGAIALGWETRSVLISFAAYWLVAAVINAIVVAGNRVVEAANRLLAELRRHK